MQFFSQLAITAFSLLHRPKGGRDGRTLEINVNHPIIQSLNEKVQDDESSPEAEAVAKVCLLACSPARAWMTTADMTLAVLLRETLPLCTGHGHAVQAALWRTLLLTTV